jgi:hypothetical protein
VAWLAALCPKDAVTLVTLTRWQYFCPKNKIQRVSVTKDLLVFFVTFVIFVAGFSLCASWLPFPGALRG